MSNLLKKALLSFVVMIFLFTATGCDEIIIGTNLEKGDKYYQKGDYQKALECYMKAAEEYQARLGKAYSNKQDAKNDASKMVEAYCKSGLTSQKLANDSQARAMFEKAIKNNYTITESYYVKQEVQVPAGYVDRWVPAANKQVFVDGHYEDVWKDGGTKQVYVDGHYESKQVYVDDYKEIYVDAYYRADGTYVNGYYKKVKDGGHYETKQVYVD
ncbi:MAG TPA: tetratricopeptide repeat protein, partial [Candidatus Wallbacteria bacterium]|nr:tetratricopeptide repeat protein [Candidatus Wallbacteria bacterium]